MRKYIGIAILAALLTLVPPPLRPCSVGPGYRVPSDYELVKSHDVIVLARSEEFADGKFLFRILKVLKGTYPNLRFQVEGRPGPCLQARLFVVLPSRVQAAPVGHRLRV